MNKFMKAGLAALSLGILASCSSMKSSAVTVKDITINPEWKESPDSRVGDLINKPAPAIASLSGWQNSEAMTMADLEGKIVVLDFWATWCGPCIRSIPHMNEMQEKYKDQVVFIGVCHPKGSDRMNKVVSDKGIKYPVAIDSSGDVIKSYKVNGFPDYHIITPDGKLILPDCRNAKVEEVLNALLAK